MKLSSFFINGRKVSYLEIDGRPIALRSEPEPVFCDALCFENASGGDGMISLDQPDNDIPPINIQISYDGRNWREYIVDGEYVGDQNLFFNDKVYFKAIGSNEGMAYLGSTGWHFWTSQMGVRASGNVNSLLEEDPETARTMSLIGHPNCYAGLFQGMDNLLTPPELPATTLSESCYMQMFQSCSKLTQAPELPATTLDNNCYLGMFWGCTSLTIAPDLPAETLADSCYIMMFSDCTSLTQAPELPATTLRDWCYYWMFSGCSSLNNIKVGFTEWNPTSATEGWLPNNIGDFHCKQELIDNTTTRTTNTVPTNWNMVAYDAKPKALCFTAEEDGVEITLKKTGLAPTLSLQCSYDGATWETWNYANEPLLLNEAGDMVYVKAIGSNARIASGRGTTGRDGYRSFQSTGRIAASGNLNSLLEEDDDAAETLSLAGKDYCYYCLFNGNQNLTQAPELPATTLASYCYSRMFYGCTSLTQAPELPATTLASSCYQTMFYNCTSLEQAPELQATTLAYDCYNMMFNGCTSLNSIKVGFTNWTPPSATVSWLPDNTGTFECPWDLITNTSTRTTNTVPSNWSMVAV